MAYQFPGNVRELKNAIEHAVILAGDRGEIRPEDLPRPMQADAPRDGAGAAPPAASSDTGSAAAAAAGPPVRGRSLAELREAWLAPLEQRYLTELIAEHGGNVRRAAEAAGVNPVTFYRLLKRRGIVLERRARRGTRS